MNIAILNYLTCSVDLWSNLPITDEKDIERYLTEELGYSINEIYYMCGDEIPCYLNDNEEPFEILR